MLVDLAVVIEVWSQIWAVQCPLEKGNCVGV